MEWIEGGVTAAKGFRAAGMHCGIRPSKIKPDLALIAADHICTAAGLFTKNNVRADCVKLDQQCIVSGKGQAIIANSGIANACAPNGFQHAQEMQQMTADALGIDKELIFVGSTGVIGTELHTEPIYNAMDTLVSKLTYDKSGSDEAAHAIMTTDTRKKEMAVSFELDGKTVVIGGISKGSGMIHPNMGTMLCYLTTDVSISSEMLKQALKSVCDVTFNRISVDGDTSTNDSLIILADGDGGNDEITEQNADYAVFENALKQLCTSLARAMAKDGEGAKHLITCTVDHAESEDAAEVLSKSVISSTLTKAAIFGEDANWGRVLCALGYSGIQFDVSKVDITFSSAAGSVAVCKGGRGLAFDEDLAKKVLHEDEVVIEVDMHDGDGTATCWGCDLTYDYVKINGDYRT